MKPLSHPDYDRLWAVLQDLEIPVQLHSGTGSPNYGSSASVPMLMISEIGFYAHARSCTCCSRVCSSASHASSL